VATPGPPGESVPARSATSADGTRIAGFELGGSGDPIILVHGTSADHTTWRVSGPLLARNHRVVAVDRRGRGASGDGPEYAFAREFEDLVAVAQVVAAEAGRPIDVVGHSLGGRIALGAALDTDAIRRLVTYESAPPVPGRPYQPPGLVDRLRELRDVGRHEELLAAFMTDVVGMSAVDLAAYRADPIWPRRVAAAHTIVRELEAEASRDGSLEVLGGVRQPVLQVLGGDSRAAFGDAIRALDDRLERGSVVVIPGARHGAHHTHAPEFVAAVEAFLSEE
jgi:pimeloyl-ACP methyl ester carboxylesterase